MNVIFEFEDVPTVAQSGLPDDGIDIRVTMCEESSERFWFDCRNEARADASGLESDMAFGQSATFNELTLRSYARASTRRTSWGLA